MRPKTNRRLILLAACLVVLAVGAFAAFFVRGWQRDRMSESFRVSGQEAFKARQYYKALTDTGQYLSRVKAKPAEHARPVYADALLTYAESRRLIEEHDGHHLRDAIPWYQQYRDARPDDQKASLTLLQSLNQIGLYVEARDLADKMLPKDLAQVTPEQVPILRELALALRRNTKPDTADSRTAPVLARLLALAPLDVQANLLRLELDAASGRKTEARAYANQLLKDHPDAPAAMIVAAYASALDPNAKEPDLKERHRLLCLAAGLDPESAARVNPVKFESELEALQLVEAFDDNRAFAWSHAVLKSAADSLKSQVIERLYVRRLWQDGENDEVLARTATLDPSSPDSHSELLGFRALCLQRAGKSAEASSIAAALAKREGDFRAAGWAAAIPLADPAATLKPAEAASAWKSVIDTKADPIEPVFIAYYGAALQASGRTEEARREWQRAHGFQVAASWVLPPLRITESLLAEGRAEDAARAANDAVSTAPDRAAVIVTWFEAHAARIQKGSTEGPQPAAVLEQLEKVSPNLAQASASEGGQELLDRLIVPRVILLARSNRKPDAIAAGLEAARRDPPPKSDVLQRLAGVSAAEGLKIEDECMRRIEATEGSTVSVLFVRASELAAAGKPDEGAAILRAAVQKNPKDPAAQLALARFLDRLGKPEAAALWARIGDEHPDSLDLQKACLQSAGAAQDSAFIERTIKRYAALIGSEPGPSDVVAHTARARAAMWGHPSRADRDKAVGLLAEVVRAQPTLVEPKVMLASALAYADSSRDVRADMPGAIKQLSEASAIEPRNFGVALDLARLCQAQKDFVRSREILTRLASDTANDPPVRRAAAEMLIAQGEPGPVASAALANLVGLQREHPEPALLVTLAEAYAAQRQDPQAKDIYEHLAGGLATDPDSIYMTARYFALHGDPARADTVLARIDTLKPEPGIKDYALARLAADREDLPGATTHYEAALTAAPARADIWRQYASLLLRSEQYKEALAVAERAVKAAPSDTSLPPVLEQARLMTSTDPNAGLKALITALAADPAQADAAEALRALDAAAARGEGDSLPSLLALADKFPNSVPLQLYVARRIAPSAPERAAVLARRAMASNPTDPAPAKSAAAIYVATDRWADLLTAALEWQKRDSSRPVEADIAVAQAHLGLGQYDQGLQVLAPRLERAKATPTDISSQGVLNIYARLLCASGKQADARDLLAPLLSSSDSFRMNVWLALAAEAVTGLDVARSWIDQLLPLVPPEAANERLAIATSFTLLAQRFRSESKPLYAQAQTMMEQITSDPKTATAPAWEGLGVLHHSLTDVKAAEVCYRKALEIDPKRSISLNNLADILMEAGKLDEALPLAVRAVEANAIPANLDTLAAVHRALGQRSKDKGDQPAAAASFKSAAELWRRIARADAGNPDPLAKSAQMYEYAGSPAQAAPCYEELLAYQGIKPEIVAATKNNLAMCLIRLKRTQADLDRAVLLASEASRAFDQPPFWDTLGWCSLAAGKPVEAQAAFRHALATAQTLKQPVPSAAMGLATTLAAGTAEQRAEGKQILGTVDPSKLEAEDADRFARARALLDAPR